MNAFRKQLIPGALVLIATLGVFLPACSAQDKGKKMDSMSTGSNQVLAVVNGKPVTEADVRAANADQFKALDREYQQNLHQLIENSLTQAVQDRMLESEAAAAQDHQGPAPRRDQARRGDRRRGRRLLRAEQGSDPPPEGPGRRPDQDLPRAAGPAEGPHRSTSRRWRPSTRSTTSSSRSGSTWPPPVPPRAPRAPR